MRRGWVVGMGHGDDVGGELGVQGVEMVPIYGGDGESEMKHTKPKQHIIRKKYE